MKRTLINYLGLLGMVSLLSYTAAVIFSPLAYPDYHWLSQAVSDLSAEAASSRTLWNQLSALYMPCGIVCCTVNCIAVAGKYNKMLRLGVYLFALMNWVTAVGYAMFPLTDAGTPNGFQNIMHLVVTGAVVALSILALVLMICGGCFQGGRMMEIATKLLVCAGTLMLIAGAFFGFLGQWLYAALIWAGAMGCLAAEMNVKNQNRSYKESTI